MKFLGKTVAFIPVRGGSKSIPLKNIKPLAGRPLLYWVLDAALGCPGVDCVVVSTDDEKIAGATRSYNSNKVLLTGRSKAVSTDSASTESVMLEFAETYDFETIVLVQATSPLLRSEDLQKGFSKYGEIGIDSVLSVVRQKRFLWKEEEGVATPLNYNPLQRPRRQDFNGQFVENGAFYITSRKQLLETRCRISGRTAIVKMPETSYFEIDEPDDWIIVEQLLIKRHSEKNNLDGKNRLEQKLAKIRCVLTDCDGVLTDGGMYYSEKGDELKKFNTRDGKGFQLLRENGILTGIITGENTKLMGCRARKLQVEELHMGIFNKKDILQKISERHEIPLEEILYIGDDINDMEVIRTVGVGCAVRDAMSCVKDIADYVTIAKGGRGAFREVAEMVINIQKK